MRIQKAFGIITLTLCLSFFIQGQLSAASVVTFDNANYATVNGNALSFPITIGSGVNRAITIGCSWSTDSINTISVTVGGVAANLVPSTDSGSIITGARSAIYVLANPASGLQAVAVSWTTTADAVCGAVSVTGADQVTPMNNGTFASNVVATPASVTVSSTAGDLTFDVEANSSGSTPNSPTQTSRWAANKQVIGIGGGASTGPGTAGPITHIWNYTNGSAWTDSGANFKQATVSSDTQPPTVPTNLSATAISQSQINLTWTASTDNVGVTGYKIFRNGTQIGTSATNSYADSSLSASTGYTYTVSAYDAAGNNSSQSSSASATTQAQQQSGGGSTVTATSCSSPDVQSAINSVSVGGTVIVPAGNCVWTQSVTISSKKITLQGAGEGVTNITDNTNGSSDVGAINVTGLSASNFLDISGFTFISGANEVDGIIQLSGSNPSGTREVGFRFHNNAFVISGGRGISVFSIWGLLDHNTISSFCSCQMISLYGSNIGTDGGFTPWTYPLELGTDHAVIIEDNTITYGDDYGEDSIDGYTGARVVIRHNTFNNSHVGFHGTDSGNSRSLFSFEIYNNNFINSTNNTYRGATIRGGTGVYYNNTFSGTHGSWYGITLMVYRGDEPESNWGQCNGTNYQIGSTDFSSNGSRTVAPYTGLLDSSHVSFCSINRDTICTSDADCGSGGGTCSTFFDGAGTSGYACRDQPGRTHNQVLSPIYAWNNTGPSAPTLGVYGPGNPSNVNTYIQAGRDYFDNTPMPGYVAYTYPDPLQGSPSDTLPPTIPQSLSASPVSTSSISLTWSPSTDNVGVTGYNIYRGGVKVGTSVTNSYSDTGLSASTLYTYTVSAYDAAGNTSAQSVSASATTQASSTPVPGDLNLDHIVNSLDFSLLNSKWNTNYPSYDLYPDGIINSLDYAVMSSNWGKTW